MWAVLIDADSWAEWWPHGAPKITGEGWQVGSSTAWSPPTRAIQRITIEDLQPPGINLDGVLAFRYEPSRERYTVRLSESGGMTSVAISYEEAKRGRIAHALLGAVERFVMSDAALTGQESLQASLGRTMNGLEKLVQARNVSSLPPRSDQPVDGVAGSGTHEVAASVVEEKAGPMVTLPPITSEALPWDFVGYEDEAGPGGDLQMEGVRASNGGDKDRAATLYEEALAKGLTSTHEASAHSSLGEIYLMRGELQRGVASLLRCLATRPLSAGTAHQAAVRLEIIYQAAGRHDESRAVAQVAGATATPGIELAHSYAEKLRALTRGSGAT